MNLQEVKAAFGPKEFRPDPDWEFAFSAWLRENHSREELSALFSRFREGTSRFESFMRRGLLHALCSEAGHDIQIEPGVVLKHPETMELGDSIFLGAQAIIQGRSGGTCKIGSHVWIGPQAFLDARDLVIEDYVGWGPGAKILGSAHTGEPMEVPIIATNLVIKPVVVGYGSDVGTNATILPGVRIGAHAIVGAGAVVTSDVPDYGVVAGVPARLLRRRKKK